jgi:hypothetical protein
MCPVNCHCQAYQGWLSADRSVHVYHRAWSHVDAAYAGSAGVCPEQRERWFKGVEVRGAQGGQATTSGSKGLGATLRMCRCL